MSRKKAPEFVVGEDGQRWNLDDFDLDSYGVVAPQREVFEKLAEDGFTPEQVSVDIQETYKNYLERMRKKNGKEEQKQKGDDVTKSNIRMQVTVPQGTGS